MRKGIIPLDPLHEALGCQLLQFRRRRRCEFLFNGLNKNGQFTFWVDLTYIGESPNGEE